MLLKHTHSRSARAPRAPNVYVGSFGNSIISIKWPSESLPKLDIPRAVAIPTVYYWKGMHAVKRMVDGGRKYTACAGS